MNSGLEINKKRQAKGMQPRPVRAAVIGFPNVGKSSLINRILGRKLAKAQNVAGFTRKLQWIRISGKHDGSLEVGYTYTAS
jgi:ribosome biogenesis GTPase A